MRFKVEVEQQVIDFLRALPPQPRLALKRGIKKLASGHGDVRALQNELEGFHRLRVQSYRVIYYEVAPKTLRCVLAESRDVVYALYAELLAGG